MTNGRASARGTHFPISFTATVVPRSVALYTFPKLPLPILTHSRLDDRSAGSKSGPSIAGALTFFALFLEVFRALATGGKDGHRSAMREAARENAASAARTKESAPLASRETRSRGRCPGGYRSPRALLCANDFFAEGLGAARTFSSNFCESR